MNEDFIHSLFVDSSDIEGSGLFCNDHIKGGEHVAPILFEYDYDGNDLADHNKYYLRSDILRFTNHKHDANCIPHRDGDVVYLMSSRDIPPSEEICVDYFNVIGGLDPFPNHLPYLKNELIRLLPSIGPDVFFKERDTSYVDDLSSFASNSDGNPDIIKIFLELIKKLSM